MACLFDAFEVPHSTCSHALRDLSSSCESKLHQRKTTSLHEQVSAGAEGINWATLVQHNMLSSAGIPILIVVKATATVLHLTEVFLVTKS